MSDIHNWEKAKDVTSLITALNDDDGDIRVAAVIALGNINDPHAVAPLISKLNKDSNVRVRIQAAKTLGEMQDKKAIEPLIKTLCDNEYGVHYEAEQALIKFKSITLDPLINAYQKTFGTGIPSKTTENQGNSLIKRRSCLHQLIIKIAAKTLGKIGDTRAIERLGKALDDKTGDIPQVVIALVKMNEPQTVASLISKLKDSNVRIRFLAAKALGKTEDKQAIKPLIDVLSDDDAGVRNAAGNALMNFGITVIDPLITALERHIGMSISSKTMDYNSNLLTDGQVYSQVIIIKILGKVCDKRAIPSILRALKVHNAEVRYAAAAVFINIPDPRGVEPLIRLLGDSDKDVRSIAAKALGIIGDPRAIGPLINALDEKAIDIRQAVIALAKFNDARAIEPFINTLAASDSNTRWVIVSALGRFGDSRVVKPLVKALDDFNTDVRLAAAASLKTLYSSGKLGSEDKRCILSHKGRCITAHIDRRGSCAHHDSPSRYFDIV